MPESVYLDFTPPDREDLTKLHIFEGSSAVGPWSLVETVSPVGDYPNYISSYTTALATNKLNFFTIQWEDAKGAKTEISNAIQGGTLTLIGEIVERVLVRDNTLDEQVVLAETEALLERYFGVDPYTIENSDVGYATKNSLAKIVQAKSMYSALMTGSTVGDSWTAGLVSMKSSSSTSGNALAIIDHLLKEAARELGLGVSIVAHMANLEIAGGFSQIVSADISRLQIEVE